MARSIAHRMSRDGFLTAEDLAAHEGEWGEPISSTYRGYTVYETPPPTQGLAVLLSLNLLEGFDVARYEPQSPEHLHLLIEMTKLAYADRDRWVADPARERVPVEALLGKSYAERRRRAFDPEKAQWHQWGELDGDTTGFVVADAQGNVMSVIQSLYKSFGSGRGGARHRGGAPEPRRLLQHRPRAPEPLRAGQAPVPHPDRLRGHARRSTGAGLLQHGRRRAGHVPRAVADQRARLRHGDPGGHRAAALRGRPASTRATWWTRCASRAACPRPLARRSRARATTSCPVSDFFMRMGHAHGITLTDGTLRGGADPRGDGAAIGF